MVRDRVCCSCDRGIEDGRWDGESADMPPSILRNSKQREPCSEIEYPLVGLNAQPTANILDSNADQFWGDCCNVLGRYVGVGRTLKSAGELNVGGVGLLSGVHSGCRSRVFRVPDGFCLNGVGRAKLEHYENLWIEEYEECSRQRLLS